MKIRNAMKNIIFVLVVIGALLTSCTTTREYAYTSIVDYMDDLRELNDFYNRRGFYISGEHFSTENDLHIDGYGYGYGYFMFAGHRGISEQMVPVFQNDYLYKNSYRFQDSLGNAVVLTLGYRVGKFDSAECIEVENDFGLIDKETVSYNEIVYSEVCDCETSSPDSYTDLCKSNELQRFNNGLDKNSKAPVKYIDNRRTNILLSTIVIAGLSVLIAIGVKL